MSRPIASSLRRLAVLLLTDKSVFAVSLAMLIALQFTMAGGARAVATAQENLSDAYALVVGIADYRMGKDAGYAGRYGLVNLRNGALDALAAREMLTTAGMPAANIRLLTDEAATKAGIVDGLEWLVSQSQHASRVIYYHSGHGTNSIPDIDGDEALLNARDFNDEALLPHDAVDLRQFDSAFIIDNPGLIAAYQERLLVDDELYSYLRRMQCPVLLIIDACFSGGVARGKQPAILKAVDLVPRECWELLPKAGSAASAEAVPDILPASVTLLAASQEGQTANEIANLGGVFTYWLKRAFMEQDDMFQADMRGDGDGAIDIGEAYDYAYERVLSYTAYLDDPGSIQEPFALNLEAAADVVIAHL